MLLLYHYGDDVNNVIIYRYKDEDQDDDSTHTKVYLIDVP